MLGKVSAKKQTAERIKLASSHIPASHSSSSWVGAFWWNAKTLNFPLSCPYGLIIYGSENESQGFKWPRIHSNQINKHPAPEIKGSLHSDFSSLLLIFIFSPWGHRMKMAWFFTGSGLLVCFYWLWLEWLLLILARVVIINKMVITSIVGNNHRVLLARLV